MDVKRATLILITVIFLVWIATPASAELAAGKTCWDGGTLTNCSLALDRNNVTSWIPNPNNNGYIGVDLGSNLTIDRLDFLIRDIDFFGYITINGSSDNSSYYTIQSNTSYTITAGTLEPIILSIPNNTRYVNISLSSSGIISLAELYIYSSIPILISPSNALSINLTFPPLTSEVNFSWDGQPVYASNIIIAKDTGFSVVEVDTITALNYSVQSLEAGTYYWKVRYYNTSNASYYDYSSVYNFSLIYTTSILETSINGVIYELIGDTQPPISGADVYLYNSTSTQGTTTGSNGYYQFTGLNNASTYSIYAKKTGYDTTDIFPVTPEYGTTTTFNIKMKVYISPYIPNFVFEKIVVRNIFDQPYQGLTINVYKNNDIIASFTGTTDSNGVVVFQLIKDQYYRMEISGGSLTSTVTNYFYAKEETQRITIAGGFPTIGDKYIDINSTLFVTTINSTHSNLSLYYSDNSSTTSIVYFYATNKTTNLSTCSVQNSTVFPTTLNCTVVSNGTYIFGFNATNTKYGFFQQDKVVNFNAANTSVPQVIGSKMSSDMLHWISILGIIFIAGLFSVRSNKYGVVVVPIIAELLYWLGALNLNGVFVHTALVIGILAYMRMSETKVIT